MQNFILNLFENNHYIFQKLARPWKSMVHFGPVWNIWKDFGYSKGLLNEKKIWEFHMFCISLLYLLLHVPYMLNFKKKKYPCLRSWCWCKIGVKWSPICPNQLKGPLLEITYIPLLSVTALHYHRLDQISSLVQANLSLEDMKQLLDRSHLHRCTYHKTNNY